MDSEIEEVFESLDVLAELVRLDACQGLSSACSHVLVDHLLDTAMIMPDKPRSSDKVQDGQYCNHNEVPEAKRQQAVTDSIGRANDGSAV